MKEGIVLDRDYDQVMFLGEDNIILGEFRLAYPQTGSLDHVNVVWGEPWFSGLFKRDRTTTSIEKNRFLDRQVLINGKKTLIVLADVFSVDKNRSMMDFITSDFRSKIDGIKRELDFLKANKILVDEFIRDKNIESEWEEWMVNKLELLRVANTKASSKLPSDSGLSINVDSDKGK